MSRPLRDREEAQSLLARLRDRLERPVPALPLELFRIASGVLGVAYFLRLLSEFPSFGASDGFLDHRLLERMYPFTRLSLFHSFLPDSLFVAALALGAVASFLLALGWHARACAFLAFAVAVSEYRWHFPVMYVDDALMHLLFFWLALLPVGRAFGVSHWLRQGRASWTSAVEATVPGGVLRCFLANVCLLYLVAGLWKLESPFWQEGFALYAIFRLPIARFPDFWTPEHLRLLEPLTHAALWSEVAIPILLLLPRGSGLKWLGLFLQAAFHLGIVFALRIPFANLACLATALLFFREEIAGFFGRKVAPGRPPARLLPTTGVALGFLALLSVAMTRRLEPVNVFAHEAVVTLWVLGFAQDYQLFNWIDKKNFYGRNVVWSFDGRRLRRIPEDVFPGGLRGALLQAHLHDVRWLRVPAEYRQDFKKSILQRVARRFCRGHPGERHAAVWAAVQRITPENADLSRPEPRLVVEFLCTPGGPVLCETLASTFRSERCGPPLVTAEEAFAPRKASLVTEHP
ncbi:MAG: hypothetical protein KatS3mg076_3244 [Candidatus Binatia bacterium]|nr:MAG: hypothetical protein KatS3mg076_3244 [Candidatus Binatia bacterium]